MTQTIHVSQGCPCHIPSLPDVPSRPQQKWVPHSRLCCHCEQIVVPGTPDIQLEAVITQCIIWLLNGLFTKVCMMKSQAWQCTETKPVGRRRCVLSPAPTCQLQLLPSLQTLTSLSHLGLRLHDIWKYLAFLPQVSSCNKPQWKSTSLCTGLEKELC